MNIVVPLREDAAETPGIGMPSVRGSCNLARVVFEVDAMSASVHHASMKMQDPFRSGRCLTAPVFVSSVQQRGAITSGL